MPNKQSILMVEPNPVDAHSLMAYLSQQNGLDLVGVVTGANEALNAASRHQPDVILIDLDLPNTQGLEIIEGLAQRSPSSHIIIITARDPQGNRADAIVAGAREYLSKPLDIAQLDQTIKRFVRLSTREINLNRFAQPIPQWVQELSQQAAARPSQAPQPSAPLAWEDDTTQTMQAVSTDDDPDATLLKRPNFDPEATVPHQAAYQAHDDPEATQIKRPDFDHQAPTRLHQTPELDNLEAHRAKTVKHPPKPSDNPM